MIRVRGGMFTLFLSGAAASHILNTRSARVVISGLVKDSSGAVVPGAELTLRFSTSAAVKETSGCDDLYRFPGVPVDIHDLTVSAEGFQKYIQRGISLDFDQQLRVDTSLEAGTTTEAMEISANAMSPILPTQADHVRRVVTRQHRVDSSIRGFVAVHNLALWRVSPVKTWGEKLPIFGLKSDTQLSK